MPQSQIYLLNQLKFMEFVCSMKMYAENYTSFMPSGGFVNIKQQFVPCQIFSKMYKLTFLVAFFRYLLSGHFALC